MGIEEELKKQSRRAERLEQKYERKPKDPGTEEETLKILAEQIVNGGFENGLSGWTYNFAEIVGGARSGSYCVQLGIPPNSYIQQSDLDVKTDDIEFLRLWVRQGLGGSTATFGIRAHYYGEEFEWIIDNEPVPSYEEWTLYTFTSADFTPGKTLIGIEIYKRDSYGGYFKVDDVSLLSWIEI